MTRYTPSCVPNTSAVVQPLRSGYVRTVHLVGTRSHNRVWSEDLAVHFDRAGHDDLEPMTNVRVPEQPITRRHFQHYDRGRIPRIGGVGEHEHLRSFIHDARLANRVGV